MAALDEVGSAQTSGKGSNLRASTSVKMARAPTGVLPYLNGNLTTSLSGYTPG